MRISDRDFLILRYLRWNRQLFLHPHYQKKLKSNRNQVIQGRGTSCLKNYLEGKIFDWTLLIPLLNSSASYQG